jgi:hypothetical protein
MDRMQANLGPNHVTAVEASRLVSRSTIALRFVSVTPTLRREKELCPTVVRWEFGQRRRTL